MGSFGFAVIAAGVVVFALVSRRLESSIITPPMIFAVFGLVIGGSGLGLADLGMGHGLLHEIAQVTLMLVLFSDAARINLRGLLRDHNLPVRMLAIGMPLSILLGTGIALLLPLGLSIWEAALLAALMAPTDAALGQAVISNPRVPLRIRQALNVESGLNDGIALPMVFLFASLAGAQHAPGNIDWVDFILRQLGFGPLAGIAVGSGGAWLLNIAARRGYVSETYEGVALLALAFLSFSSAELVGGNGFIAAFVAGLVFGNFLRERCTFIFEFAEAEGQLLVLIVFMAFGATLLPQALDAPGWAAILFALLALTVIRMVPAGLSLLGTGLNWPSIGFLAWFGPRGLASILFALFVLEQVEMALGHVILSITVLTVGMSILAHGISAAPLARRYGRYVEDMQEGRKDAEMKPVTAMPLRARMSRLLTPGQTD